MISKIRVRASDLQDDGLIPAEKKKSGLFSHRPDLLFCASQSSCTRLHTKGRENKSKSASESRSIYHCRVNILAAIRILSQMYFLLNGSCGDVYTVAIKALSKAGPVRSILSTMGEIWA